MSPPAVLYAVSRHWLLCAVFLACGAPTLMAVVHTEADRYQAVANLHVNLGKKNSLILKDGNRGRNKVDSRGFLERQEELLSSETVIRSLVEGLGIPEASHEVTATTTRTSARSNAGSVTSGPPTATSSIS